MGGWPGTLNTQQSRLWGPRSLCLEATSCFICSADCRSSFPEGPPHQASNHFKLFINAMPESSILLWSQRFTGSAYQRLYLVSHVLLCDLQLWGSSCCIASCSPLLAVWNGHESCIGCIFNKHDKRMPFLCSVFQRWDRKLS